jgi:hypothetical protein
VFASVLGCGTFDGAWLVQNFENQNPANTLWSKQYNLYSKIDTEASRYLGFERWWGGHVKLDAGEIQSIVDDLFVGNKLAAGLIRTSDGNSIDLRSIRSPIVVFCSRGDNITPPQQALGWILDLYDDVDEIRSYGQTIVYAIHEKIGHLGIFVSGGVARKEHDEFSSNIDLIDTLPPGLYEAVFTPKADVANPELVSGEWAMRCEARTLADIRALGGNDAGDERCFATAAKASEANLVMYRTFARPFVRAWANPISAEWMRRLHPLRLQYELLSDANPLMASVAAAADQARQDRRPVAPDNPFVSMQEAMSRQVVNALDAWRDAAEALAERTFFTVYGNPFLQRAVGIDPASTQPLRKASKNPLHQELLRTKIAELRSFIPAGGVRESLVRAALYIGMAQGSADERSFETIRRIRTAENSKSDLTLSEFKALVRRQYFILLIDQDSALTAIPAMLRGDANDRRKAADVLRQVVTARGDVRGEVARRLDQMTRLFEDNKKAGDLSSAA